MSDREPSEAHRAILELARTGPSLPPEVATAAMRAIEARIDAGDLPPPDPGSSIPGWAWLGGGAVAAVAVATAVWGLAAALGGEHETATVRGTPEVVEPIAATEEEPANRATIAATAAEPVLVDDPANLPLAPTSPTPRKKTTPKAPATDPPVATIEPEVELIAAVKAALRRGDPEAALDRVHAHARRFPDGQLAEVREAARVQALCALGREGEAEAVRTSFVRTYPGSAHTDRVRRPCVRPETNPATTGHGSAP